MSELEDRVRIANKICGTNVPLRVFLPLVSAFKKGEELQISEICDAFDNFPQLSIIQILRYFRYEASAKKDTKISGQSIDRSYLIDLISNLECYTGKTMLNCKRRYDPLSDYDNKGITVLDIATYFSSGKGPIAELKNI